MMRSLTLIHVILVLSGIAGLGYQLVWVRQFAVGLGHEIPGMLAVVAGFFAGLALGAWKLDPYIGRSRYPGRWYIGLELVIGVWALLSIPLIGWLVTQAPLWIGLETAAWRHWAVAFGMPMLALLPATFAMGATLPAMERLATRAMPQSKLVGGLYAANTAGAVIGTLGSTYWLMPAFGHTVTIVVLATINIIAALLVAILYWNNSIDIPKTAPSDAKSPASPISMPPYLASLLVITGLLGIGYEVVAVRVMAQVLEGTVYSFAAMLSVYLVGTTVGAMLYQRLGARHEFKLLLSRLLAGIAVTGLFGILALYNAPPLYQAARLTLGDSLVAVLLSEGAVALSVFALPSMVMGATLSHLLQAARSSHGGLGRALALNTFGAALAPGLVGVLLLITVGALWALAVLVMAYVLLMPAHPPKRWLIPLMPVLMLTLFPAESHMLKLRDGETVLDYREGVMASVAVVEREGDRNLRVNNRFQMGGTSTDAIRIQRPQTHIPLLLHPGPDSVLFLGTASGVTTGAATLHEGLAIDAVELVPESLSMLSWFEPANRSIHTHQRARLMSADARRFVRSSEKTYDVIIADLFQPGRDGAGLLYTREHFEAVRERLQGAGLFAQWLPLYQLDDFSIRVIIATFLDVFPHASSFLANNNTRYPALALIGSAEPISRDHDYYDQRVVNEELQDELEQLLLGDGRRLFGQLLFDHAQMATMAEGMPLNTDDHPLILYEAPRFTHRRDALPFDRLLALIDEYGIPGDTMLSDGDGRQQRYLIARNAYLEALSRHMMEGADPAIELYKRSAAASDDFTTSYAQIVKIALVKNRDGSHRQARELLEWLKRERPDVPAAGHLLARLGTRTTTESPR